MSRNAETVASIIEFFSMLSGGFFIALYFDIFRSIRKAVKRNDGKNFTGLVYLQDFLFLIVSFVILVLLIYRVSGGNLDWYISLGCITGAVAYYYLAEPIAGKLFFAIFFLVIKMTKTAGRIIKKFAMLFSVRRLCRKFVKKGEKISKKTKKTLKKAGET